MKFFYFFRGDLSAHVEIYKSWVDSARKNIDINMLTLVSLGTFWRQYKLVKKYRKQGVKVYLAPSFLHKAFVLIYFCKELFACSPIVLHTRKQNDELLFFIKKVFGERVKIIFEVEGDFKSEADYLKVNPSPFDDYGSYLSGVESNLSSTALRLSKLDALIVHTNALLDVLSKNHQDCDLKSKKKLVMPTGFDGSKFFFDQELRGRFRKSIEVEDNFVFVYSGNIFYSWQNIQSTIRLFNRFPSDFLGKRKKLLLLIKKSDLRIARHFLDKEGVNPKDYILKSVEHGDVNSYLNAADVGLILRSEHVMNKVCAPGKLGEYLGAGLFVVATPFIGLYSEKMNEKGLGYLWDMKQEESEVFEGIIKKFPLHTRESTSVWARDNFSSDSFTESYVIFLKNFYEKN